MDWSSGVELYARYKRWKQKCENIFQGPLLEVDGEVKCKYLLMWSGDQGFDQFVEESIRDAIVFGIDNQRIRFNCTTKGNDLTLNDAIKFARTEDCTTQQLKQMDFKDSESVHTLYKKKGGRYHRNRKFIRKTHEHYNFDFDYDCDISPSVNNEPPDNNLDDHNVQNQNYDQDIIVNDQNVDDENLNHNNDNATKTRSGRLIKPPNRLDL
ncbi:hypothetical protein LOTGIDRAFT_153265 [Lottia gigantea]|uniref:Uncharacterized protein n=1 Tax=Lottia gigantea TaxID=225164 RepID=V4BXG9_LOTGI|nr:hypothetical protein LOTGIDRAFT_153265 [Lottia gigantea]ESO93794.1 hypothetical protein LOTGIDRAFT_153265 [Lottia gigantea]